MDLINLKVTKFLWAIIICQAAGIIGSLFTFSAIPTWYAALNKPFFSPPNWLFGPVWLTLYTLMGVSLYLIWQTDSKSKMEALKFFWVQLCLNAIWSIVFFGLKSPILAFAGIMTLWYFIFATILKFKKISPASANLLIPYLLWVSFASILNIAIVILN